MSSTSREACLPDPDAALGAYLDTLLAPPPRASGGREEELAMRWREALPVQGREGRVLLPAGRVDGVVQAVKIDPAPLAAPFAGLLDHEGRRCVCVDLDSLLSGSPPPQADPETGRRAVLFGDARWALLCEATEPVVVLEPQALRWRRSADGPRPWLVGVSHRLRSALLDADELGRWLWRRLRSGGMSDAS